MATIKPAEVSAILKEQLIGFNAKVSLDEVGTVLQIGDGIARVFGLSNVQFGELVLFEGGLEGIVQNESVAVSGAMSLQTGYAALR